MKEKKFIGLLFIALMTLLLLSSIGSAAVPLTMNYQGYLTAAEGTPVDAAVSILFSIYDTATGGTALWSETQSVVVSNGIYNVVLGSVDPAGNPLNLPFDVPYFLGVKVETDLEMTPRHELTSAGYAFRAFIANTIQNGAVTDEKITGPISGSKISSTGLDADTLDSKQSSDFAAAYHAHDELYVKKGQVNAITNTMISDGAVTDSKISGLISSSKISPEGLNADMVDGKHIGEFALSSHYHNEFTGNAGQKKEALLTFYFDDGFDTDYTITRQVFKAQGERAAFFPITDSIGADSQHCQYAQYLEMENEGFEIGSHSRHHDTYLTSKTEAQVEDEAYGSKTLLEQNGLHISNFSYPLTFPAGNTSAQDMVRRVLSKYYRGAAAGSDEINPPVIDEYNILTKSFERSLGRVINIAALKSAIDDAVTNNLWILIYNHRITAKIAVTGHNGNCNLLDTISFSSGTIGKFFSYSSGILEYEPMNDIAPSGTYTGNCNGTFSGLLWDERKDLNELIGYAQSKSISIVTMNQALDKIGNTLKIGNAIKAGTAGAILDNIQSEIIRADMNYNENIVPLDIYQGSDSQGIRLRSKSNQDLDSAPNIFSDQFYGLHFNAGSFTWYADYGGRFTSSVGRLEFSIPSLAVGDPSYSTTTFKVDTASQRVGIGTTNPQSTLDVKGYLQINTNNGRPAAADCDSDSERGRMILDYSGNAGQHKLWICTGSANGWDSVALGD